MPLILLLSLLAFPSHAGELRHGRDPKAREEALRAALKSKPGPLPLEAKRRMARGEAAVELAADKAGFERAAAEFEAAIDTAPWHADAYYNLSVAREKAGDPSCAAAALRLYLLAKPDAEDAEAAQKRLFKLEYAAEQAAK